MKPSEEEVEEKDEVDSDEICESQFSQSVKNVEASDFLELERDFYNMKRNCDKMAEEDKKNKEVILNLKARVEFFENDEGKEEKYE